MKKDLKKIFTQFRMLRKRCLELDALDLTLEFEEFLVSERHLRDFIAKRCRLSFWENFLIEVRFLMLMIKKSEV